MDGSAGRWSRLHRRSWVELLVHGRKTLASGGKCAGKSSHLLEVAITKVERGFI